MSARRPLVSVVVPVRDGEEHLREALDSILAQTYPHLEVIVMDDASTDATASITASYGERIRYRRQESARGIYANANDGIAVARGELIAVYHADDVYHREIVEREAGFLEAHPDVSAVFCQDVFIDADGRPYDRLRLPPGIPAGRPLDYATVLNALLTHKNVFLRCPSSMVRASAYRELGGYRQEQFKNTSDIDMWLRLARRGPIAVLDEHLFWYRHGHGSSSERYHHLRTEPERFFEIMDLHLDDGGRALASKGALAAYEAHRAEDLLKVAVSHYALGQRERSRTTLAGIRYRALLGSPQVQRYRLLVLLLALRGLVPLPRIPVVASLLSRRLYGVQREGNEPDAVPSRSLTARPGQARGGAR